MIESIEIDRKLYLKIETLFYKHIGQIMLFEDRKYYTFCPSCQKKTHCKGRVSYDQCHQDDCIALEFLKRVCGFESQATRNF